MAIECFQTRIINLQRDLSEACNKTGLPQKSQKKKHSHGLHKKKNVVAPCGTTELVEDDITLEMLFGVNSSLLDPHMEGICKEVSSCHIICYFFFIRYVMLSDND